MGLYLSHINIFTLKNDNNSLDGYIWRCRSRVPQNDIKLNIRKDSLFEQFRVPIVQLYYLAFFCFTKNTSLLNQFMNVINLVN